MQKDEPCYWFVSQLPDDAFSIQYTGPQPDESSLQIFTGLSPRNDINHLDEEMMDIMERLQDVLQANDQPIEESSLNHISGKASGIQHSPITNALPPIQMANIHTDVQSAFNGIPKNSLSAENRNGSRYSSRRPGRLGSPKCERCRRLKAGARVCLTSPRMIANLRPHVFPPMMTLLDRAFPAERQVFREIVDHEHIPQVVRGLPEKGPALKSCLRM